jgi:hypothetical protein
MKHGSAFHVHSRLHPRPRRSQSSSFRACPNAPKGRSICLSAALADKMKIIDTVESVVIFAAGYFVFVRARAEGH